MATFTTFDAPANLQTGSGGRRATAKDFGGGAEGFQKAAVALDKVGQLKEQREERQAGLFREETIANDRLKWATRLQELKAEGNEDATEVLQQEMKEHSAQQSELMTTKRAKEDYKVQTARLSADVLGNAVVIDAAAIAKNERTSVTNVIDFNMNAVRAAPSEAVLNASIEQVDRLINASRLKGQAKTDFLKDSREDLYAARADGMLSPESIKSSEDAEVALDVLKTKLMRDNLSPKAYDVALGKAQTLVDQYQTKEDKAAVTSMKEQMAENADGFVSNPLSHDEIDATISDPDTRIVMKQMSDDSNRMNKFNKIIHGSDIRDIEALQADLDARKRVAGDHKLELRQQAALNAARGPLQAEANEADRTLVKTLETPLQDIAAGVEGADITDATIARIQDDDLRTNIEKARTHARNIANIQGQVEGGATDELKGHRKILIEALQSPEGDRKEEAENLAAFDAAYAVHLERVEKDPATYARETNQAVAAASKAYSEDNSVENMDALVEAQSGAQARWGVDPRDVHIMPTELVGQFKDQMSRVATDPDAPEKVFKLIQQQQQAAGKHWPLVMKQFKEQGAFNSTQLIVAGMTRPDQMGAAQALLVASSADSKKSVDTLLTAKSKSATEDEVAVATSDLRKTLVAGIVGGEAALTEHLEAVSTLAKYYVLGGASPKDAATKAANEVVMENYTFGETYRVPRGAGVAVRAIDARTRVGVSILNFDTILIPKGIAGVPDDENQRQYRDSVKNNGFWVTNQDESGLILVDEHKNPVLRRGSLAQVELTWEEMRGGGSLRQALRE